MKKGKNRKKKGKVHKGCVGEERLFGSTEMLESRKITILSRGTGKTGWKLGPEKSQSERRKDGCSSLETPEDLSLLGGEKKVIFNTHPNFHVI